MPFPIEALEVVKKIVTLEQRVNELTEDVRELSRSLRETDRRLSKIEAKLEVYDGLIGDRPRRSKSPKRKCRVTARRARRPPPIFLPAPPGRPILLQSTPVRARGAAARR